MYMKLIRAVLGVNRKWRWRAFCIAVLRVRWGYRLHVLRTDKLRTLQLQKSRVRLDVCGLRLAWAMATRWLANNILRCAMLIES